MEKILKKILPIARPVLEAIIAISAIFTQKRKNRKKDDDSRSETK